MINFDDRVERPYELWLEREPENKYDPRAIMVCVSQADYLTKSPTMQTVDDSEIVSLCLGYLPKDLAYSLSQIIDNPHIFEVLSLEYFQKTS